jgi:hypothetical protein
MLSKDGRQAVVFGGILIFAGVLWLVGQFIELSAWVWVLALAAGGLGAFGLYLADRSDWWMLLVAYVLWAIALLIALVVPEILQDEAVATYVLFAIGLPFLAVYLWDRALWWALIPAYVMLVVGVMIGLIGLGVLDDMLVPAFILLAIALPFFVVFARDRRQWWALIPGGILAVIGLFFLIAEAALEYIGGFVLLLVGAWILARAFAPRRPRDTEAPPAGPQEDEPPLE